MRVFDTEPDLLAGVPSESAATLTMAVTCPLEVVDRGPWTPREGLRGEAPLGLLILDGFLVRRNATAGGLAAELLGAGDLLGPWRGAEWSPVPLVVEADIVVAARLRPAGADP